MEEPFNKQMKAVYTIIDRGQGRSIWVRVGVGFTNRDGSLNLRLDAVPVNGTLQVREWEPGERRYESLDALSRRNDDGHGRRADGDLPGRRNEMDLPGRRHDMELPPRRNEAEPLPPRRAEAEPLQARRTDLDAQSRPRTPTRDKPADSVV